MESIIEKKCVSIEPRAMHWVDHCVCLFLRKLREKRKKKYLVQVRQLQDSKIEGHEKF